MPELPEVESVVRVLAPRITGRRLQRIDVASRKPWARMIGPAEGKQVRRVRRYGKYILFDLDEGLLAVHLGMTGKLLVNADPGPHARAVLVFDGVNVVYDDVRQFGSMRWLPHEPEGLGPDALEVAAADFARMLLARKGRIKALLLNQAFLRGLGNIYSDEALFRAGIHPLAEAGRLSRRRILRLHSAIKQVLEQAIAKGGSSISDYLDPDGRRGWFQIEHRVYGRAGEPCKRCGARIRRILVAQRSTHFCPQCQRK